MYFTIFCFDAELRLVAQPPFEILGLDDRFKKPEKMLRKCSADFWSLFAAQKWRIHIQVISSSRVYLKMSQSRMSPDEENRFGKSNSPSTVERPRSDLISYSDSEEIFKQAESISMSTGDLSSPKASNLNRSNNSSSRWKKVSATVIKLNNLKSTIDRRDYFRTKLFCEFSDFFKLQFGTHELIFFCFPVSLCSIKLLFRDFLFFSAFVLFEHFTVFASSRKWPNAAAESTKWSNAFSLFEELAAFAGAVNGDAIACQRISRISRTLVLFHFFAISAAISQRLNSPLFRVVNSLSWAI